MKRTRLVRVKIQIDGEQLALLYTRVQLTMEILSPTFNMLLILSTV